MLFPLLKEACSQNNEWNLVIFYGAFHEKHEHSTIKELLLLFNLRELIPRCFRITQEQMEMFQRNLSYC